MNPTDSEMSPGWIEVALEEIVEILDRLRVPLNGEQRAKRQGPHPYFGANGQVDSIDDFIFDGNYVLLAEDGGYFDNPSRNVAYRVEGKFWANNHVHVLLPLGDISSAFVTHFFNSINWMPHVGGTTRLKLTQSSMRQVPIKLPPIEEQRRIVAKVEALQHRTRRARAALDAIPPLLEQFRQSVLAAAFRGDLTADWRASNPDVEPASALLERIRAERRRRWEEAELAKMAGRLRSKVHVKREIDRSSLPQIPSTWCWVALPEVGEMARGKSKHRPRNDPSLFGDRVPFLQTGDVAQAKGVILAYKQKYSDLSVAQSRIFPAGTVCITIAANIAESGILGFDACFPDSIVGVIPDQELVSPEYLECFIRTAREDLARFAPATAQANINLSILSGVAVPVPPHDEMKLITDRIDSLLRKTDLVAQHIGQSHSFLDALSRSVLAKAFRGDLVPQDPNDEPASKLLERIRAERSAEPPARRGRRKAEPTPAAEPPRLPPTPAPTPEDEPARPEMANARDYTLDDWRRVLLVSLGDEPADRQDAIEAAAIWAAENQGLVYERLPKNGVIVRGLKSALRSAIRRGEVERLGPSEVRLVVPGSDG